MWLANVPKSKREQCKGHAKLTYDITIPDLGNVNETSRIQNGINDSLRSGTSSTTSSSGNHEIKHLFIPKDTGPLIPSALFAHPCRVQVYNTALLTSISLLIERKNQQSTTFVEALNSCIGGTTSVPERYSYFLFRL